MISFIIPSYNNLKHLKNVYSSIKRNETEAEIILLDDGSTDGSWEWMVENRKERSVCYNP
jgi:glycosyltransferase involved in cell wall biosynthesis